MTNKLTRNQVYVAINGERRYQDEKVTSNPSRSSGPDKSVGEYLVLVEHYARQARDAWCHEAGDYGALVELRKMVAVAVRCMEQHGVPERPQYLECPRCEP